MAASYPISAVAKLTGIPLDTLRAWERRYQAVTPKRVARGRVYSELQVKRLLLLRQAVEGGHAIGQVAKVGDRGLRELLDRASSIGQLESAPRSDASGDFVAPVLRAIDNFDYAQADRELNWLTTAIANPKDLVHRVALPLMRTIGERWHQGKCSIAQEHMLTSLLSALLSSFIRMYTPYRPPARILLATMRNEHHGFPNLAAAMLAAAGGLGVIHLGTDLPAGDILLAARKTKADGLLLSLSKTPDAEMLNEILSLGRKVPKPMAVWIGGAPDLSLDQTTRGSRWKVLDDFAALEVELAGLGGRF